MNKVVISFWFRVPTKTAEEARASTGVFWDFRVFHGVVPLLTWGAQQDAPITGTTFIDTGALTPGKDPIYIQQITTTHRAPVQPSCIGVRVGSDASPWEPPVLEIHIQTNNHAVGKGLSRIASGWSGNYVGKDPDTGKPIYSNVVFEMEDVSNSITDWPEYLGNSDSHVTSSGAGHPEVALDQWHHLLISWELLQHSNLAGACKMWCSIDDKNKDGENLPAMNDTNVMGPNDHMAWTCFNWQGDDEASVKIDFKDDAVPIDPWQIPAPPTAERASNDTGGKETIQPIAMVELAELQVFTDVTLNTAIVDNRRAFIDYLRDAEGNPVLDADGKQTLQPVNPAKAELLLGRKPKILLHGAGNWQNGVNTGALGIDSEGNAIAQGQFVPSGNIAQYKPDPSLKQ
jgi:hypothetical protein